MKKMKTESPNLQTGLPGGNKKDGNPTSNFEWERMGMSFSAWKKDLENKKNTSPKHVIPGPGSPRFI
jgi:hypothetical protein